MRTPPSPSEIRIQRLEEEVERLSQALISLTRCASAPDVYFPKAWGLMPQEASALRLLYKYLYADREALRQQWQIEDWTGRHIDVVMCRLRRKLTPIGVEIETERGKGYRLSPTNKARLKQAMGAYADHESRASSSPTPGRAGACGAVEPHSSRPALLNSDYHA